MLGFFDGVQNKFLFCARVRVCAFVFLSASVFGVWFLFFGEGREGDRGHITPNAKSLENPSYFLPAKKRRQPYSTLCQRYSNFLR